MTSPCTSPCSSCALLNPLQKLLANIFRVTRTTRLLELKAVMKGYVSCFQNAVTPKNLKAREYYTLNVRSRGKQFASLTSSRKHQDSRENKTNWFPEGPGIKCFVIFLDFHFNVLQQQQKNTKLNE